MTVDAYQHIVVRGGPFQRGQSHGEQAKCKIQQNIARYKASPSIPPWEICTHYISQSYLPAIEKWFPTGLLEMEGIAAGAEVSLEEIVLLNARYDLARSSGRKVGECTSLALHGTDGSAWVAQNWDMAAWLHDQDAIVVLESHYDEEAGVQQPRCIIGLTEAGQLVRSGMNSRGLGLSANSLWTSEDVTPDTGEYLPFTLARAMFLQCATFAAGLKTLNTFPRHVSGNLMVASPDTGIDLELTPSRKFILDQKPAWHEPRHVLHNLITHANHFDHPSMNSASTQETRDTYPGRSSLFRATRLRHLLRTRLLTCNDFPMAKDLDTNTRYGQPSIMILTPANSSDVEDNGSADSEADSEDRSDGDKPIHDSYVSKTFTGSLALQDLKWAFSDHSSFPRSLCEHKPQGRELHGASSYGEPTMTVACVIYDLARGEMRVSEGNPCCNLWSRYSLEMEQDCSPS